MTDLAVVTPTLRADLPLFEDLHRSILAHTSDDTVHHVIVPPSDRDQFRRFEGRRCRLVTETQVLPRRFMRMARAGWWINLRSPWPPVRGWVLQQVLKLAVAAELEAKSVLIADSDVVLMRSIDSTTFSVGGRDGLFRLANGVHEDMPRHVVWHQVARRLLGLPALVFPPLPDYVSSFNIWDPSVLRAMQRMIEHRTGKNWIDALTSELHVSEFVLYGVFVDEVLSVTKQPPSLIGLCHDYWERVPLTPTTALEFVGRMTPDSAAIMVSAKSRTPVDVRRAVIRDCESKALRSGSDR